MRSYVLANDHVMATLDHQARLRELYWPLPGGPGLSLGRPARIGLILQGVPLWLDEEFESSNRPFGLDLIARQDLKSAQPAISIEVETWVDDEADMILRSFLVTAAPGQELVILLHLDLAFDGNDFGDGIRAEAGGLLHWKGERALLHRFEGPGEDAGWTLGRRDREGGVIGKVGRSGLDRDPCAVGAGESIIARRLRCDESGRAEAQSVIHFLPGPDELSTLGPALWRRPDAGRSRRHALEAQVPATLSPGHATAFRTSLAHLSGFFAGSSGAVIASPDLDGMVEAREHYGYVWPRDAALDALTLIRLGLGDRADALLEFLRRHRHAEGWFHQRLNADGSPASTWHPRRADERLRPIQSDETALAVLAAARRVLTDGPRHLFADLVAPAADFLLRYRDEKSGLPLPSHDLWEERFGVHTFTVCATIAALREAALAAEVLGQARADWRQASETMRAALRSALYHEHLGRFARRGEITPDGALHLDMTLDSSLAALFLFEVTEGIEAEVAGTMIALETGLELGNGIGGLARYENDNYHRRALDPDQIPGNPWLIGSFWASRWRLRRGDRDAALALIDRMLALGDPSGALPEQVHPLTGKSVSVQPLAWSHAELLEALLDLAERP